MSSQTMLLALGLVLVATLTAGGMAMRKAVLRSPKVGNDIA